jgi:sarcosine oxidase
MTESFDYVVIGLGGLGSAACWELARRGHRVVGLERFELGHSRGASHDTSRILRHSYHTPAYVRLTQQAYDDWARLEGESGESLVTRVGGLDLFPPGPAIGRGDYTGSMDEVGITYELLDVAETSRRWPQFRLPPGTVVVHQADAAIVPAARTTRVMQEQARRHGAVLRDRSPVIGVDDLGRSGLEVRTADGPLRCGGVVVTADAWVNDVLGHLGLNLPVDVTLEQVTYFAPEHPEQYAPGRMPLWIWMGDPSFYGFPCYGEPTVKAAQDCGGPVVDPDDRGIDPDPTMLARLTDHMRSTLPGSGEPVRSVRCQYTLPPDRDFVLAPVPGHEQVVVGLGAGHSFKFAPTFGRLLADLVTTGETATDVSTYRLDRPALTEPDYAVHWLV